MELPRLVCIPDDDVMKRIIKKYPHVECIAGHHKDKDTVIVVYKTLNATYVEKDDGDGQGTLHTNESGFDDVVTNFGTLINEYKSGVPIREAATRFVTRLSSGYMNG